MDLPSSRLLEDVERKASAKIERSRRIDEERKRRIFAPNSNSVGNREALDAQVREKKELEEEERRKDALFTRKMMEMVDSANKVERRLQEERRRQEQELLQYREVNQLKEQRREFDLNDPGRLRKTPNPSYECNTLASVVMGKTHQDVKEDQMRLQRQREDQRLWLLEQMEEKRELDRQRGEAQRSYDDNLLAREKRAMQLSSMEQQLKRRIEEATRQYNTCLAQEQAKLRHINQIKEKEDEKAEVENAMSGDFLTENPKLSYSSALGPGKLIVTHFKGLTPQMKRDILEKQRQQLVELQERRRQEEDFNRKWDALMLEMNHVAACEDRRLMRAKLEAAKQLLGENEVLAREQRAQQEKMARMFENEARAEFFERFGSSAR